MSHRHLQSFRDAFQKRSLGSQQIASTAAAERAIALLADEGSNGINNQELRTMRDHVLLDALQPASDTQ